MRPGITVRRLEKSEYPCLRDFLYLAIFIPEGMEPPPRSILEQPDLQVYIQDFGTSPHDRAFCAVEGEKILGAVWVRIMDDYGHLAGDTPSLAVAILPEYRGQGIGTALMQAILTECKGAGYPGVSLSVQTANRAMGLYKKCGFETVREENGEALMLCRFK